MAPSPVTPENLTERVVRLETRGDYTAAKLTELSPLSERVAVAENEVAGFKEDLNNGLDALRLELAEIKSGLVDRAKERRTMLLALILAGVGLVGTFGAQLIQLRGGK